MDFPEKRYVKFSCLKRAALIGLLVELLRQGPCLMESLQSKNEEEVRVLLEQAEIFSRFIEDLSKMDMLIDLIFRKLKQGPSLMEALMRHNLGKVRALLNQAEILLHFDEGAFDFAN